jgi:hypothetical protein
MENAGRFQGNLIVVGRTVSPDTGQTTYGGYKRRNGISRLRFRHLNDDELLCDEREMCADSRIRDRRRRHQ